MNVVQRDVYVNEEELLRYWELHFQTWNRAPDNYERLLDFIGEVFHTTFIMQAPLQLVGNFWDRTADVLILEPVPQMIETREYKEFEEKERELLKDEEQNPRIWMHQIRFAMQYFNLLGSYNLEIPYYKQIERLIKYYKQEATRQRKTYESLQNYAIQTNLLPFYTKEIHIKAINELTVGAFDRIKRFYLRGSFDILIITDKELYETLQAGGLLGKSEREEEFIIGVSGLEQKGLFVDVSDEVDNTVLQRKAREMRKIVTWNREHYWKTP